VIQKMLGGKNDVMCKLGLHNNKIHDSYRSASSDGWRNIRSHDGKGM
jgi:hypothetical protein